MKSNHSAAMTSVKPYLIRAFHEWIVDNALTPYIEVNTKIPGTDVPHEYIKKNKITLNIAPLAVQDLHLTNDLIDFYARFSGVVRLVRVPVRAVLAIYAKENGHGTAFGEEESSSSEVFSESSEKNTQQHKKGKPDLRIVE
jgi:stringent starvation protein B